MTERRALVGGCLDCFRLLFVPGVTEDARLRAVLDDLDLGASWRRYIAERGTQLADELGPEHAEPSVAVL